jgi:hypothetical protein
MRRKLSQEHWRNVPLLPVLGNHRDCLAVVLGDDAVEDRMPTGLKRHALTDAEIEHVGVSSHLLQELQAGDDSVVEVDELCLGQFVDVDLHGDGLHLGVASTVVSSAASSLKAGPAECSCGAQTVRTG